MPSPVVMAIAHRGASEAAPENTLAAFHEALRLGTPAIEFDVRLSGNGIPVVIHDETVDRTTWGKARGPVNRLALQDLQQLDAGSWKDPRFADERIPTLEAALQVIVPTALPVMELKVPLDAELLGELVQRFTTLDKVLVISFEPAWLIPLRRRWPQLPLGLLADEWTEDLPQRARNLDAGVVVLNVEALAPERVLAVQNSGLLAWCFTGNDVGRVRACAALGVRGIVPKRPGLFRDRSGGWGGWEGERSGGG
ncbi:MAG: glycerophosphodiester phosphodiesterase family protein, partial [Phycisphaerae bacterium]